MTRPWRGMPDSLVPRLVLVAVLAGVLAALAGGLLLRAVATNALRERVIDRDITRAEELAGRLATRIDTTVTTLQVVANNRFISRVDGASVSELRALLRGVPTFDELVLYDSDGEAVAAAASGFAAELVEFAPREDVAAVVADEAFVAMTSDIPPTLETAVAVERPPGTVVGFVLAKQRLEALTAPIEKREAASVSFLVDGSGRVLVHPERDRVVNAEVIPADALAVEGAAVTRDGRPALMAAAPVANLDAWVVVEEDEEEALRPVAAQLQQLVAILIAVLAAVVLATSIAGQRLLRPLKTLSRAVQRLARGERRVRAGTTGRGEVRLLSAEFDRMAATIDDRDVQLEQLHHLALLVSAGVGRQDLPQDLVTQARVLLGASGCAFTPVVKHAPGLATAADGEVPAAALLDGGDGVTDAADGARTVALDGHVALAVPVTTLAGTTLGRLTIVTGRGGFDDQEIQLAQTFASFAGVALDNARRLQLEQAVVDELQEAIETKRMFVGGVTHELRTPLTCIEGFSTALLEGWQDYPDDDRMMLVEKIRRHALELDALVTQLLDFAAAERGRRPAELTPVALDELIAEMGDELSPILRQRRLELDVTSHEVLGDANLLRRALTNLVSNAAKYSPPHSTITIRAIRQADAVRVEVADEGIGMSADEAQLAFQPFWRARGSRSRGTGLGLSLVAEYVRAMGGTIGVSSKPGQGSTFHFTIPLAPVREVMRG